VKELIEQFFAIAFLVVGVSHALQPGRWSVFFQELRKTGHAGFVIALFTLPSGLVIVLGHNEWSGVPVILTVAGWGMTLKSVVYLLAPEKAERVIPDEGPGVRKFVAVGIAIAVAGALLAWHAFLRGS
jgi:hypothetical protein